MSEMVKCECGHSCPEDKARYDGDDNLICPDCMEGMRQEWRKYEKILATPGLDDHIFIKLQSYEHPEDHEPGVFPDLIAQFLVKPTVEVDEENKKPATPMKWFKNLRNRISRLAPHKHEFDKRDIQLEGYYGIMKLAFNQNKQTMPEGFTKPPVPKCIHCGISLDEANQKGELV